MTTAWWIAFGLASLWPIRRTMRQFYHDFWLSEGEKPSWLGVLAILLIGLATGPVVGMAFLVYDLSGWYGERERSLQRSDRVARLLAGESRADKTKRQEKELSQRGERIKQLERELEL